MIDWGLFLVVAVIMSIAMFMGGFFAGRADERLRVTVEKLKKMGKTSHE
jgi:hypothetical protein